MKTLPSNIKRFLTRRNIIILSIILLLISLFFIFSPKKKEEPLQFATVQKQTIRSTISSSGILNGIESANLKFNSGGRLAALNIKVGEQISKGHFIASLDTRDLSIALQQAQNNYRDKQAQAEKILDDVKNHSGDETFTQKQTRTSAEAARDTAYDGVKAAQQAFNNSVIYAPISGTVTKADPHPGQFVSGTETIAQIVDWSQIYFDADIDESDISKVSVGNKADVTLNSYSDQVFAGVVTEILPNIKTTSTGSTVITIRINLGNPNIQLISGLNGQASIITREVENTLVIPIESLKDDNTVFVKSSTGVTPITVKTGIQSDSEVEIIEGLSENQQVIKNPSAIKSSPAPNFFRLNLRRG